MSPPNKINHGILWKNDSELFNALNENPAMNMQIPIIMLKYVVVLVCVTVKLEYTSLKKSFLDIVFIYSFTLYSFGFIAKHFL